MATKEFPIVKLNNGDYDYYPLTVASAVALSEPIVVKSTLGGFKAGEVISVATTIYDILSKLFNYSTKELRYDKITIKTNKQGEMYVNRDALVKFDDNTLKENSNHTVSVDVAALVDNKVITVSEGKITLDLTKLIDGNTLVVNKNGSVSVCVDKAVRVDNDGIIKDSHGRICFNRKSIRVDGKYIYKNEHNVICFDDRYLTNFDPDFIILNDHGDYTLNTDKVVTTDTEQTITANKSFTTVFVDTVNFEKGSITSEEDGIVIKGIKDVDDETSVVSKKFLLDKLTNSDTFLTIPMFDALNMKSCYDVRCHSDTIQAGDKIEGTNLKYSVDIPAGHIEVLKLRSSQTKDCMNVIVDWGDGTSTSIKNSQTNPRNTIGIKEGLFFEYASNDNEKNYYLTHVYPDLNAEYTVSIYGNTYWGIHHSKDYPNLLCRIFTSSLPICNCVKSLSDIANGSLRLVEVDLPAYYNFSEVQNFSGCFKNCLNLKRVRGFNKYIFTSNVRYACSVFQGCANLEYCDAHVAGSTNNYKKSNSNFFDGCKSLKGDIVTMLPSGGFSNKVVSMSGVFKDCTNLICSDWDYVASILWDDASTVWKDTEECFSGCTDEFRANIPEDWGGLKKIVFNDDVIIIRNMDEVYSLVKNMVTKLKLNIDLVNDTDLYNAIKTIAGVSKIKITLKKDTDLVKAIETLVVSLGANQLITLF